ncbi:MAG: hypothetical protein IPL33_22170 [Sphingobacteriales bacterium]|nr:hypothetical protein [Sphingobacteriales bacterium]
MEKLVFIVLLLSSAFLFNACERDLLTEIETSYAEQSQKNDFFDLSFAANNHPTSKIEVREKQTTVGQIQPCTNYH